MQINNRNEDLTKVFDRTWKANHNNDVKEARKREKEFMDKMFNVKKPVNNIPQRQTPSSSATNLQKNMEGAANFQRSTNLNNIIKKWK